MTKGSKGQSFSRNENTLKRNAPTDSLPTVQHYEIRYMDGLNTIPFTYRGSVGSGFITKLICILTKTEPYTTTAKYIKKE